VKNMNYSNEKMRFNCESLKKTYMGSLTYMQHKSYENRIGKLKEGKVQLSLTPTLFWYDNTHICETSHYRDFIFDPKHKNVTRGGFVEDKLSPNIMKAVERLGLELGHSRYGCYLLDDHSGYYFTGHLDVCSLLML